LKTKIRHEGPGKAKISLFLFGNRNNLHSPPETSNNLLWLLNSEINHERPDKGKNQIILLWKQK